MFGRVVGVLCYIGVWVFVRRSFFCACERSGRLGVALGTLVICLAVLLRCVFVYLSSLVSVYYSDLLTPPSCCFLQE